MLRWAQSVLRSYLSETALTPWLMSFENCNDGSPICYRLWERKIEVDRDADIT